MAGRGAQQEGRFGRVSKNTSVIVISGVDGSGKSSVIKGLQARFDKDGKKTRYRWLRYNHYLTKFLLAFCRFTGFTRYEHFENTRVTYHDFHRSSVIGWLFIALTFIDTFFVSILFVYLARRVSDTIILCDRWVFDIMVDLETDTRIEFSERSAVARLFKWLIPGYARCYLIMRDVEKVRGTRDESLKDPNFLVRYKLYERHSADPLLTVIDNNGILEDSVGAILNSIQVKPVG